MEALQQKDDILYLTLHFVEKNGDSAFIVFLQNAQINNTHINLNFININQRTFLLLQNEYNAFLLNPEEACLPQYERFFANIKFFADTDKDLSLILQYLQVNVANIDDTRIAKSLIGNDYENALKKFSVPFFKIAQNDSNYEVNFSYIKGVLIKGFEISHTWGFVIDSLKVQNKFEIYTSIINERFKKYKFFNEGKIQEISDIYNILDESSQKMLMDVYNILKDIAIQQKIPQTAIINIHAIEAFALKSPQTFEDVSSIVGFNKNYVHNAIIRKLLGVFSKNKFDIKRNRPLEIALETLLIMKSAEAKIDRNFIASKHEIIAYLNGNLNVDFLKGWKNSVFGTSFLDFINGKSAIQVQNKQLLLSKNEEILRR